MVKLDLAFFSKLSCLETRREATRFLAQTLGAEDIYIFDFDEEVKKFLPSSGFPQTYADGRPWREFLNALTGKQLLSAKLLLPTSDVKADILGYRFSDDIVFCFINPAKPIEPSDELKHLIDNLRRLLKSERLAKRHEAQNLSLRELTNDLRAYSEILSRTRSDLNVALQETRAQRGDLHDFFTQVPAPMVIFLGPEFRFHLANPSYVQLVQRDVEGKTLREAFTDEEVGYYLPLLTKVYQTGEPFVGSDLPVDLKSSDGSVRNLRINVSYTAFRDSERKIKGVLVFVEDVTAQYLARSKVQELAEEAQLASQAKSQFLANMSHEIRTPMNAILGFSELLRDPDVTAQEHDEFVRRIRANGDHLLALIDDILDLSRVEAGKMSFENVDFSIVDMVSELNASFSVLAKGRTVQTRLELTNAIPSRVKSDPTRVRQIIMNMVSNAVKFTDSGSVDIRVTYVTSPASAVCITVRDTGIGIPENAQAELFKPFRQADNSITRRFGGTGLGLSLSRRIAEALGGSLILVKSKLGEGSTFQFTLPIGDVSDDELISAVTPASPTSSYDFYSGVLSGLTLLLAEDSPDNRAVLQAFLRKTEAKLIFAEDGIEAVRRAKNEKFDLILMDIQMPELDGLSATRELRRAGLAVPIVALTAHALPEEIKRSHEAGCNGHLTKPINRDELVSAILRFAKHLA